MFDFFRRHTRALQFVLVLLVFPSFVFFGIQGYSRFAGGDLQTVAKVAGQPVTQAEFDAALRDRVERARRQMPTLDAKVFETPEMRAMVLDGLVRERVALSDAEVEAYYKDPAHAGQFQAPEQATVEYVTLDLESVKKNIAVTEDDLRRYYTENEKRYTSAEERRASHILVKADKDAPKA